MGVDEKVRANEKLMCQRANVSIKAQNLARLRAAERTASYKCDQWNSKCKWEYKTVTLATENDCRGLLGRNAKRSFLIRTAHSKAESLKEQKKDIDILVAELSIRLEDARNRAQWATNARETGQYQDGTVFGTTKDVDAEEPYTIERTDIIPEEPKEPEPVEVEVIEEEEVEVVEPEVVEVEVVEEEEEEEEVEVVDSSDESYSDDNNKW